MVKKREFVEGMAIALDVPHAEVMRQYRALSEARLITFTGGRGRAAPDMSLKDAVQLLIALLTTDDATKAPQAVKDWGSLLLTRTVPYSLSTREVADQLLGSPFKERRIRLDDALEEFIALLRDASPEDQRTRAMFARVSTHLKAVRAEFLLPDAIHTFDNDAFIGKDLRSEAFPDQAGRNLTDEEKARQDFEWRRAFNDYSGGLVASKAVYGGALLKIANIFGAKDASHA